jgi:predicted dehydrogenase
VADKAGTIRVGVVGLGSFGSHHVSQYAAHPAARLVAVADANAAHAGDIAGRYHVDGFADHRALIGKVDAVSIATPTRAHHRVALDLIEAGIHVLIEKPITADSASAAELVELARHAGVILQVGHIERFSPAFAALVKRVEAPRRIAAVRKTEWTGRSGDVDVVLDLMIHDIDLVLTLVDAPVASVTAGGAVVRSGRLDEAEAWLTFDNGVIATLSASRVAKASERKLTVTELHRVLVADFAAPALSVGRRSANAIPQGVPLAVRDKLADEIDAFLESIATRRPPLVDGKAGLAALEVAERIEAAIAADAEAIAVPAGALTP